MSIYNMKDIKIELTNDILELDLTIIEKAVLAMAKSFTNYGKYKCLNMSENNIAKTLGCSYKSISRAKDKLKSLGYIRIEYYKGNIDKIFYLNNGNNELYQNVLTTQDTVSPHPGQNVLTTQDTVSPHPGQNVLTTQDTVSPHNTKEIKNNNNINNNINLELELEKDNNLELEKDILELGNTGNVENEQVKDNTTNWDKVKRLLPGTYNFTIGVEDKIEFIERTESEFINHINKFYDYDNKVMTNAIQSWVRLCSNIITEKYNKDNKVSYKKQSISNLRKSFFSLDDF